MITLFRRMREKYIGDGNVRKYLVYGIGEILLVVIGILIALQLDQWKTTNQNRSIAQEYIQLLILDLEADVNMLEDLAQQSRDKHEDSQKLMSLYKGEANAFEDSLSILIAIQAIGRSNSPSFRNNTYNDLVSTGNIQLFNDREMIDGLMTYYTTDFNDWLDEYIYRLWREYLPVAIDLLPSAFLEDIVLNDSEDVPKTEPEEYIKNYDSAMAATIIDTFRNSPEMDFQLKNVSRTHLVHLFFLDQYITRAQEAIELLNQKLDSPLEG